jgi:hypothetical protein
MGLTLGQPRDILKIVKRKGADIDGKIYSGLDFIKLWWGWSY